MLKQEESQDSREATAKQAFCLTLRLTEVAFERKGNSAGKNMNCFIREKYIP